MKVLVVEDDLSMNVSMKIVKEFEIIHPAQEFNVAPKITREHMNCILQYDYEVVNGSYMWESICFVKTTTAFAASVGMISAYNAVGRVLDSDWLKEIKKNIQDAMSFSQRNLL